MSGTSRLTGRVIDQDAHLTQSITDILTTPKGSRVMRRDYGSRLADLNVQLIVRLVDRATAPARSAMRAIERLGGEGFMRNAQRVNRGAHLMASGFGTMTAAILRGGRRRHRDGCLCRDGGGYGHAFAQACGAT